MSDHELQGQYEALDRANHRMRMRVAKLMARLTVWLDDDKFNEAEGILHPEFEPPTTSSEVMAALGRMDALLDPALDLLTAGPDSATAKGSRDDMRTIRNALADRASRAGAVSAGWLPIETAPMDGTEIILRLGNRVGAAIWCHWPASEAEEAGEGWSIGFDGDAWDGDKEPAHWRRLPDATDAAAATGRPTELELLQVENAGNESAAFHLGMLVDDLRPLLARAMATMKTLHEAAKPDEDGPDIDAIIPGADFRVFVDAHAALLHDVAKLPEAPGLVTACCGRSECGGECGNEWDGMKPNQFATHAPADTQGVAVPRSGQDEFDAWRQS